MTPPGLQLVPSDERAAARADARPRAIRRAATRLFAERGYHGTGMKDVAAALGVRAPSLYNHVDSKHTLLLEIMRGSMETLLREHALAVSTTDDCGEQLRRAMEAHVRFHARNPDEVTIGNREIASLEPEARAEIVRMRSDYAGAWQAIVERGMREGRFEAISAQMTTYALLEMGIGVSLWFREDGPLSESQVAHVYGDMALRLVAPRSTEGG